MRSKLILPLITITLLIVSCTENEDRSEEDSSSESMADFETGENTPLPADVILVTKPLISGTLYKNPVFTAKSITRFDTSQSILVLDTSHNVFVQARIRKDSKTLIGYIPKAILPERVK
jgi:hypothetical protein